MADKKSFIMYTEWKNVFEKLPAEKAGILIQAVFAFESGEEVSFDDPMMDAMFSLIQPRLEENDKKYEAQVERMKKVNEKRADNESSRSRNDVVGDNNDVVESRNDVVGDNNDVVESRNDVVGDNEYVNDNDNDNDNDYVNDNVNDNGEPKGSQKTYSRVVPEIVAHLNEKCGTQYRTSSSKTKKVITARLNEGYSPEDFQIVIDKMADEWLGTDMEKYLRPETLFGTKFESYLNRRQSRKRDVAGDYLRNVIQGNEGYESYRSG